MTQPSTTFVRLDLPRIPDLWNGSRPADDRPEPLAQRVQPATAVAVRAPHGFPRPNLGRPGLAA